VVEIDPGVGWPEALAELFAGDDVTGTLQQENQDAEGLLAQLDGGAAATQLGAVRVDFEDAEAPAVRVGLLRFHRLDSADFLPKSLARPCRL
jgi:hypothetical protein